MADKPITTYRGSCEDCAFWLFHDDGTGHCKLWSVNCATSITKGKGPTRFLSRYEVPVAEGGMMGEEE